MAFVYTGMGPQWWAMGRELIQKESVFAQAWKRYQIAFQEIGGFSIDEAMGEDEATSRIGETQIAQPANFIIQAALTDLLRFWGIVPDAIVGHSVGEVSAAFCSETLSLEDAIRVSYHRSRLQQSCASPNAGMLAVGLPGESVANRIKDIPTVSIAALNSPSATTLSGDRAELQKLAEAFEKESVFNRFLQVEVAYHSPQMEPIKSGVIDSLASLAPNDSTIPLYSTVHANQTPGTEWDANYWWNNVREPVRFADAIIKMVEDGYTHFIEVGPHPVLGRSIKECFLQAEVEGQVVSSLNRKQPEQRQMLDSLATLYTFGIDPDWQTVNPPGRFISLPTYPWQRERYWNESEEAYQDRLGLPGHSYLYNKIEAPKPTWEFELNEAFLPYLPDHAVNDRIVFPGAGFVEAGLTLHQQIHDEEACCLRNLKFHQMLVRDPETVQFCRIAYDSTDNRYQFHSKTKLEDNWLLHAEGTVLTGALKRYAPIAQKSDLVETCESFVDPGHLYEKYRARGLDYGPQFQRIRSFHRNDKEFLIELSEIVSVPGDNGDSYLLHPTTLDNLFQAALELMGKDETIVPVGVDRLIFRGRPSGELWAHGTVDQLTSTSWNADISLYDETGQPIVELIAGSFQALPTKKAKTSSIFYQTHWSRLESKTPKERETIIPNTLAFLPEGAAGQHMKKTLGSEKTLRFVYSNKQDGGHTADTYSMELQSLEAYTNLFQQITQPVENILFAWPLSESSPRVNLQGSLDQIMPLTHLIQAWVSQFPDSPLSLTVLTHKAHSVVGNDLDDLDAASLSALIHLAVNEFPTITGRVIDIENLSEESISQAINEWSDPEGLTEVSFRENERWTQHLESAPDFNESPVDDTVTMESGTPFHLIAQTPGLLSSLTFEETVRTHPGEKEVEIKVHSSALNYKDLMKAYGRLPAIVTAGTFLGDSIGMELVGEIVNVGPGVEQFKHGDWVITPFPGSFRSFATVPETFLMRKPEALQPEESLIYVSFLTAYHALIELGRLTSKDRVLIHSAAGALGLAAIQVAKDVEAEIYATAGTEEKRDYLRNLGIKHVMDSRSLDFVQETTAATSGQGVDVILNSLTGNALTESFTLLAPYGRFIEVGKRDIAENSDLPMSTFNRNITFASLDLDRLHLEREGDARRTLKQVETAFTEGRFEPPPTKVFSANQVVDAFRLLGSGDHIGKIAVKVNDENVQGISNDDSSKLLPKKGTYLVTGGTRGFGLEVADWLSRHEVEQIVLVSRSGAATDEARSIIESIQNKGTRVEALALDITNKSEVETLISRIQSDLPPLTGIFHGAMVLDDAFLPDLNRERFEKVLAPKLTGAWNLHASTKDIALKYFVCFSSVSSLIGNKGQANYIVANAFLDALSHYRRARNLPSTTVNWGAFSESGVVARNKSVQDLLEKSGIGGLTNETALDALEKILAHNPVQVGVFDVEWSEWKDSNAGVASTSRFSNLISTLSDGEDAGEEDPATEWKERMTGIEEKERARLLGNSISEQLGSILKVSPEKISQDANISNLGIDSLMTIELVVVLKKHFGIVLSNQELAQDPSILQLTQWILDRWGLTPAAQAAS
ncbi:MAG: SDR family NAD(P)-dependent oxidoreductase [Verrucomicrobiota bacterium]